MIAGKFSVMTLQYVLLWIYIVWVHCIQGEISLFNRGNVVKKATNAFVMSQTGEQNSMFAEPRKFPAFTPGSNGSVFSFASYYGSHMVLQQAPERAGVWGYAEPSWMGKELTVALKSPTQTTSMKATVRQGPGNMTVWSVLLDAQTVGGPYSLLVTFQSQSIEIVDVYFGDVWVCSGQSNMQFTVPQMFDAATEEEMANKLPLVRLFTAAEAFSADPLYELKSVEEPWSVASAASVGKDKWGYFSAVCWVYGRYLHEVLGIPIGLISTTWGGTPIEPWSSPDALKQCGLEEDSDITGNHNKSQLYNAMIHPFLNLTIKGAIWYQGEANAPTPDTYNCSFPAMINDWRKKWHLGSNEQTNDNFPFGFMQLGPNAKYAQGKDIIPGYADIRWHQTADYGFVPNPKMSNVFMGMAVDLTDDDSPYGPVHIRDKLTAAQRLVHSSLATVYGFTNLKHDGPSVSAYFQDIGFNTLKLEFDSGKYPIKVMSKDGFEVCCNKDNTTFCGMDSSSWLATPIVAHDQYSVTLSWKPCAGDWIMGVRYNWRETPCMYKRCAVYSVENELPAPPFIVNGII